MGILDTENIIKQIDTLGMLHSIDDFPNQIENVWQELKSFTIPTHYIKCDKVLILGMGGSAIGGDLVSSLAVNYSKVPIIIQRDYGLPAFVDSRTLVIGVSYSGETEETVDAFNKAGLNNAKIIGISTGGIIEKLCKKYKAPFFRINYGSSPRAALGYLLTSVLYILSRLGFVSIGSNEIMEAVKVLREFQKEINFFSLTSQNLAKKIAERIEDKFPIIIGSGTLSTVARRWKTQINENSKHLAEYEVFPELCHNMIVGLDFPRKIKEKIFIISLESEFDHPRNKLRQNIVYQIYKKKNLKVEAINLKRPVSPFIEMLQFVMLGDYVSYYLALINKINPTQIDMIKLLKNKLAENK